MTGTEYHKLSEGDVYILTENITTHGLTWHKGEKIVVAYRSNYEESIYVYNPSVLFNDRPSYKKLSVVSFLKAIKVLNNINTTTFLHKFNIGDTVYYMEDNKVKSSIVTNILYYTGEECTQLVYYLDGPDTIFKSDSDLFGSKKELLNSL